MVRLGYVCEISSSKANLTDDKIWLLNLDMVEQQTGKIISYYYVNKNELNGSITQFDTENILYSKLRPNLNKVVVPDRNGFSTSELLPLKPNSKILCREYLALYLRSDSFVSWAISKTAGAKMPRLGTKALLDKEIPLPPLDEQRRIAATLDKVTDLISKRRQQLDKLDELVKARFVEMFYNSVDSENWPSVIMADVCTNMRTGPFGSALHHDEFVEDGIFVLGIDNAVENKFSYKRMRYITEEKYEQLKRYTVHPGDVIVTIMGTVGRSAVIPEDIPKAINTKHLACLTLDKSKALPAFISSAIQMHPDIKRQMNGQAKGAIMDGLNLTIIKNLYFKLPPLEVQNKFSTFVEQTEKINSTISYGLEKLETLKKALMQEYFGVI